jgi:carbonic anhydrase
MSEDQAIAKASRAKQAFNTDLGLAQLLPEWGKILSPRYFVSDLRAAFLVACISLPLSLALAFAGGLNPHYGLLSAVTAGIVCALWGGHPLSISGPSNAMPVVLAATVAQFGSVGLFGIGLGCGLLQLTTGFFRLGNLIRFVPFPVVTGMTAGIGACLFMGELPRVLGLPLTQELHGLELLTHINRWVLTTQIPGLVVACVTLGLSFILPRLAPRLPAPLFAVFIPTVAVQFLGIHLATVGPIPNFMPIHSLPPLPRGDWDDLLSATLAVYAIASMETLLSSSTTQRIVKSSKTDPDQEMIGQGLGNIITAFFGGLPTTGAIARTALNIQAGAKTRRAGIFQALILLAMICFASSTIGTIPLAALAGIVSSIAFRMLHPREFFRLWRLDPKEALVYFVTFLAIVLSYFFIGIRLGILITLIIAVVRHHQSSTQLNVFKNHRFHELEITGPLNFLSLAKIDTVRSQLAKANRSQGLVVNMAQVDSIDPVGAEQLIEVLEPHILSKRRVALVGLKPECRRVLVQLDTDQIITPRIASSQTEVMDLLYDPVHSGGLDRLIHGVEKFRREMQSGYGALFKKLAENQSPHTLFITCSDSRIDPNLITSTQPGELFIVRNVGNLIPADPTQSSLKQSSGAAESAALEFALGVLNVKDIIVCGHSGCGAMKEIMEGQLMKSKQASHFPHLKHWLEQARGLKDQLPPHPTLKQAAELNAVLQLEHLKTYPMIQERLKAGKLRLHAWYYHIGESELEAWDEERKLFVVIGSQEGKSPNQRIEAGVQF